MSTSADEAKGKSWVQAELEDSFDEELEMELDDDRIARELGSITDLQHASTIDRRTYFNELFRLQSELIKLQDWVAHTRPRSSSCSRGATRRARAGSSSASPSD